MHIGVISSERQECINSVKNFYPEVVFITMDYINKMNQFLGINKTWSIEKLRDIVILSDWLRFYLLSQDPEGVWIDTDLKILKKYNPYGLKPIVNCSDSPEVPDYSWIFCNNNQEYFSNIIKRRTREQRFGILAQEIGYDLCLIPPEYFYHHGSGNNRPKSNELHWH